MVATNAAVRGLSTSDLEQIRDSLKGGRRPKVVFTESAGQMAGQVGQVVQLTDPVLSDEWVVVRFGRDELPFSPADLAMPAKAAVRRPEPSPAPARPVTPAVTVPAPREESVVPSSPASTVDVPAGRPADSAPDKPRNGVEPEAVKAPPKKAVPKAKPPAALTVTLAYSEGEWTVGAQQGAKALAKPYVIRPTEALRMVSMLDVPGVQEAVEEIVASARATAEREAQRLRSELAEVEARLADLGES